MAIDPTLEAEVRRLLCDVVKADEEVRCATNKRNALIAEVREKVTGAKPRTGAVLLSELASRSLPYSDGKGGVGWRNSWSASDHLCQPFAIFMKAEGVKETVTRARLYASGVL